MIAQVTATKLHSLLVCGDPDDDLAPRAARFEILDGVDRRRESIEGAIDHRADATVIDQPSEFRQSVGVGLDRGREEPRGCRVDESVTKPRAPLLERSLTNL